MKRKIELAKILQPYGMGLRGWVHGHYLNLAIFNFLLMFLVLLRSAGYFEPFVKITINAIVIVAVLVAILLLDLRSKGVFLLALGFWVLAGIFRLLSVVPWAERAAEYAYSVMVIGLVMLMIELVFLRKRGDEAENK